MDKVEYSKNRFNEISSEITQILQRLSLKASYIIPISAKEGDNVASRSKRIAWFKGQTVLKALDSFKELEIEEKGLRFPVQDIYQIDGKSIVVGRIEAGRMDKNQDAVILPEGERVKVLSIEKYLEKNISTVYIGECIGVYLDKPVTRGQVLVSNSDRLISSPRVSNIIHGSIFWMAGEAYNKGDEITFKCATQEAKGKVERIYKRYDPANIDVIEKDAKLIKTAEIAEVEIVLEKPIVFDDFNEIQEMGRFVFEREGHPVAGGIILGSKL